MKDREAYLEQRIRDLERVLDVGMLLISSLDIQVVLRRILDAARDLMDAQASAFFLVDAESGDIVCEASGGGADSSSIPRLRPGQGIVGAVIQDRESIRITDAYGDSRFDAAVDRQTGFRTQSMLCVPLWARGEVIGAGEVINKRDGRPFNERDQDLFTAFCVTAAVAIQSARLHEQAVRQELQQRELQLARAVQQNFLPATFPTLPGVRIAACNAPARMVGGDVYDAHPLGEDRLGFYLGDVVGKGMSAALFAARFQAEIAHLIRAGMPPGELMQQVNRALVGWTREGMFITLAYMQIDAHERLLHLVNAGHPPPVLRHADGRVELLERAGFPPLGISNRFAYQASAITVEPGACLVLYSDGVLEARNADGDFFGDQRLLDTVSTLEAATPQGVAAAVTAFIGHAPQGDDIAVMVARFE